MMRTDKGFTLIELVLVITILGLLAVIVFPSFIDITTNASQASRDGVVGSIRSGLGLYRANDLVQNGPPGSYPLTLDSAGSGIASPASPIFGNILQQPISDRLWSKVDDTTYSFTDGTSTYTYTYSPVTGTFTSPTTP